MKLEHFIDRIIPYLLVVILVILILEFFFHKIAEKYSLYIEILDIIIILVFVIDLSFKYNRMRNLKKFLKSYWLEILAIFPFFLIFRAFEELALVTGAFGEALNPSQKILHEGLELSKIEEVVAREGKLAEAGRSERFLRFLKPVTRSPRLLEAIEFYEEPKHHHNLFEKEEKILVGEIKKEAKFFGIKK